MDLITRIFKLSILSEQKGLIYQNTIKFTKNIDLSQFFNLKTNNSCRITLYEERKEIHVTIPDFLTFNIPDEI